MQMNALLMTILFWAQNENRMQTVERYVSTAKGRLKAF